METPLSLLEQIKKAFACKEQDVNAYSPLTLAYIGDGIYELVVRSIMVAQGNRSANDLNRAATYFVRAETQAKMILALQDDLTEEEKAVYRRGRNAKSYTKAKNASHADYHKATGFEALMGYLYLAGRDERMLELIQKGIGLAGTDLQGVQHGISGVHHRGQKCRD